MTAYAIYLRKSRVDLEAEAAGSGDTLARHRNTLLELAAARQLSVSKIYEEVVSGDTIAARPQMQQLLSDVEAGRWEGVLVMEVERLARGDTIDQGLVAQAFKFSDTRIITPVKSYDPNNEFDEEYFEFGLFMSRREYKVINRRLQRGRLASVKEGKWVSNRAPYGYIRQKLTNEKGYTLVPDPETSPVVQSIYQWYVEGYPRGDAVIPFGLQAICRELNRAGIRSATGKTWGPAAVRELLSNPVYCGMVRWGWRPQQKQIAKPGAELTVKRARLPYGTYPLYQGLHRPIVPRERWDAAQRKLGAHRSRPGPTQMEMQNPLSGLCHCALCGHAMARRPYKKISPQLICTDTSCPTKGAYLDVVEDAVLEGLRDILSALYLGTEPSAEDDGSAINAARRGLQSQVRELEQLHVQQGRLCDLLERGIYSEEVFRTRTADLAARVRRSEDRIAQARSCLTRLEQIARKRRELAPKIKNALEVYAVCRTPQEKNDLLKTVLQRIDYAKTTGGKYQQSNLELYLYLRVQ